MPSPDAFQNQIIGNTATAGTPKKPSLLSGVLGAALLGLGMTFSAWPVATVLAAEQPTGAERQTYDIPAGPLDQSLNRFASQSSITLSFDPALVEGLTAPALKGRYSVEAGLRALLGGSGLAAVPGRAGGYRVQAVAQDGDGSVLLGPITVVGQAETGAGPVEGFRAYTSTTATNGDALLIETPATVNVVTADFLDRISARQPEDAFQYVPGIGIEASGGGAFTGLNIRGFSTSAGLNGALQVDEYESFPRRYHFDPSLYERIDVLKGTSSILAGIGTPGGVVNFISKRPQFEPRYRIEGSVGSFDLARGTLDATGPLFGDDILAYRLIVTGHIQNQVHSGQSSDLIEDDRIIVKPSLIWNTPTGGQLLLSYEYSHQDVIGSTGALRLDDGRFLLNSEPFVGPDAFSEQEHHLVHAEYVQPFARDWSLLLGASIMRGDLDELNDRISLSTARTDGGPIRRFTNRTREDIEQDELRSEINGRFATGSLLEHQMTLGFNYRRLETKFDGASSSTSDTIDPFNPVFGPAPSADIPFSGEQGTDEKAFYFQDYLTIAEDLKLFAGVRYTEFDTSRHSIFPASTSHLPMSERTKFSMALWV